VRRSWAARRALPGVLASLLLGAAACGVPPGIPHLTGLNCATPGACQSTQDPFLLNLVVNFSDTDGDLGNGSYTLWLDQQTLVQDQALAPLFQADKLDASALAGLLHVPVPLKLANVTSGMTFWVDLEVTDAAGNQSNRPGIQFKLNLK
jgi:hypothetical protein